MGTDPGKHLRALVVPVDNVRRFSARAVLSSSRAPAFLPQPPAAAAGRFPVGPGCPRCAGLWLHLAGTAPGGRPGSCGSG